MTETIRQTIARLWRDGYSQGQIGQRLNKTRSAIAGAIARMGLQRNGKPVKRLPYWTGHGAIKNARPRSFPVASGIIMPKLPPIPITELGPLARRDGEPDHCRFIVKGDGAAALYCGQPRTRETEDCQYCDEHAARCFTTWPPTGRPYRPKDAAWKGY